MRSLAVIFFIFFNQSLFAQNWSEATPFTSPCGQFQLGIQGGVTKLIEYNNELYASGNFNEAGGLIAHCIARWNGTTWNTVYQGDLIQNSIVNDMIVFNNMLYIACSTKLLTWNGTNIDTIEYVEPSTGNISGVGGTGFCIYNGSLYLGTGLGVYQISANNTVTYEVVNNINAVLALEVFNGNLFAGGNGGVYEKNNGSWNLVSGNNNQYIQDLVNYENKLYALGEFNSIGLITANNFAKYDGQTWSSENLFPNIYLMNYSGVNVFTPNALNVINNSLILTYPTNFNGLWPNVFAKQNGVWSEIGSFNPTNFIGGQCYASCLFQNEIFVGGSFSNGLSGTQTICNLMKIGSSVLSVANNELSNVTVDYNNQLIELENSISCEIQIVDISGNEVQKCTTTDFNSTIDFSDYNPGTYFLLVNRRESFIFIKY